MSKRYPDIRVTAEPPLDVALVRVVIDDPPHPVPVRANADSAELEKGSPAGFPLVADGRSDDPPSPRRLEGNFRSERLVLVVTK